MKTDIKKFTTGSIYSLVLRDMDTGELSIKLNKREKNAEGLFVDSQTFSISEIPKAVIVLNKAFEYAVIQGSD